MNRLYVRRLIILLSCSCPLSENLADDGFFPNRKPEINWREDPSVAMADSKKLKKPMLVYVTGSFCGYCRKMDRETWANPEIVNDTNREYVPLKLDAKKHAAFIRRLGVKAFPTTIVISSSGKPLSVTEGYLNRQDLIDMLAETEEAFAQ